MNPVIIRTATGQHKPLIKSQSGFGGGPTALSPALADDPCACCATLLTCEQACVNPPLTLTVGGIALFDPVLQLFGRHTCDNVWRKGNLTASSEFVEATQTTIIWLEIASTCRWQDTFEGNLCDSPYVELPLLWGNCAEQTVTLS